MKNELKVTAIYQEGKDTIVERSYKGYTITEALKVGTVSEYFVSDKDGCGRKVESLHEAINFVDR